MSVITYRFHREAMATLPATPVEAVFDLMDDPVRLAAHMGRRSAMMAGAMMRINTDARLGRAVGSVIWISGRVLGLPLSLQEAVVERTPPVRKSWETVDEPKLLVIGRYRMGFDLTTSSPGTSARIWIDYDLPEHGLARLFGWLLGGAYAAWCVKQMVKEVTQSFRGRQP